MLLDSFYSKKVSLADSCLPGQLIGGLGGRLDNGLEGDGGPGNRHQLSLAVSCSLMAMDGLNNSGCCNGSTDGSSNGLVAMDSYRERVLGLMAIA